MCTVYIKLMAKMTANEPVSLHNFTFEMASRRAVILSLIMWMTISLVSSEMKVTRSKRFVVETSLIVKGIGIAVGRLTDLVMRNVKQSLDKEEAGKDHKELVAHFQRIESELRQQKEELQSINRQMTAAYSQHEEKIKNSLLALHEYLENPDEHNRKRFTDEASHLLLSLTVIVDGLLGQNVFNPDIMAVLHDDIGCHGRRLHDKIKPILSIVMTGLWLRGEYQRMMNMTDSRHFYQLMTTSTTKLTKRLDDMAVECQSDEKNVADEMRNIIKSNRLGRNHKQLAQSLLEFLQEKYDTKKWIVAVLLDVKSPAGKSNLEFTTDKVHFTQSGKFHTVTESGTFVAAISVDPSAADSIELVDNYLQKFHMPIHTFAQYGMATVVQGYRNRWNKRILLIQENLHLLLAPVADRVESLVIEMPCTSSTEEFDQLAAIVGSNGTQWRWKSDKFDDYAKHNGWCIDPLVIVVAVNSTANNSERCQQADGMLRNEFGQAYLSVLGDSDKDGAYIILDRQWRNNSGQSWHFVNNQLVNDFGKCVTVSPLSKFVRQRSCNFSSTAYNRMRQTWRPTGLQIVTNNINPLKGRLLNDLCLAFVGNGHDTMYAIVDKCDFTPPFLWYDWDCHDTRDISGTLRNEFSRRYLSVYENENYLHHRAWTNHPGQNWQFIHGQLRNGFGKCVAGKGWYAVQVDCHDVQVDQQTKRWTYNEKKQMVSGEGYCLSVADRNGYVVYDYCKDDAQYRWLFTI